MKTFLYATFAIMLLGCSSDENNIEPTTPPPATTQISDSNFEQALIDLGFDNELDGSILTSSAEVVDELIIDDKNISDLSGLQDFINLYNLSANGNNLSSVNVSSNTQLKFIFLDDNSLDAINVQNLPELEKLSLSNNMISVLNVDNIVTLQQLMVDGNSISQINVSTNTNLNVLDTRNTNISCIKVNNDQLANIPSGWDKDDSASYNTSCN
ncbi:hypothetical protein [uncultured Winogradskyella sp.]|uniref:hypothetical protein n=1 Tax=uncultured Winogradskyella sp. TaxID=395353 RepID=UPI002625208C|nr:hypothetical protein [uncultured Winogradskyella sp.]